MVLATVLAAAARPWRHRMWAAASMIAVGAFAIFVWGWTGPWVFEEGLALLAFFWAGMLAGQKWLERIATSRATPWLAVVGLGVGLVLLVLDDPMPPTSYLGTRTTLGVVLGVATSTALSVGVLALSGSLARTRAVGPVGFLGQRSLEIYLVHILATGWTHAALAAVGIESVAVEVVLGTAAGLAAPLGLWWLARRAGFPWLFRHPHAWRPAGGGPAPRRAGRKGAGT